MLIRSIWSDEYRKSWGRKVYMASTTGKLIHVYLTFLLCLHCWMREFFSLNYETTLEILSSSKVVGRHAESFSRREAVLVHPSIIQATNEKLIRKTMKLGI